MAAQHRPMSPHLQIYRQGLTGTLSFLHRATGVFLGLAAFSVVAWLIAVAGNDADLARFNAVAASPLGVVFLMAATASLSYHLLNGIRHLLWDIGWGFELPTVYASGWTVVVLAIVLTAIIAFFGFEARGMA